MDLGQRLDEFAQRLLPHRSTSIVAEYLQTATDVD
jgi:hypothetical protein